MAEEWSDVHWSKLGGLLNLPADKVVMDLIKAIQAAIEDGDEAGARRLAADLADLIEFNKALLIKACPWDGTGLDFENMGKSVIVPFVLNTITGAVNVLNETGDPELYEDLNEPFDFPEGSGGIDLTPVYATSLEALRRLIRSPQALADLDAMLRHLPTIQDPNARLGDARTLARYLLSEADLMEGDPITVNSLANMVLAEADRRANEPADQNDDHGGGGGGGGDDRGDDGDDNNPPPPGGGRWGSIEISDLGAYVEDDDDNASSFSGSDGTPTRSEPQQPPQPTQNGVISTLEHLIACIPNPDVRTIEARMDAIRQALANNDENTANGLARDLTLYLEAEATFAEGATMERGGILDDVMRACAAPAPQAPNQNAQQNNGGDDEQQQYDRATLDRVQRERQDSGQAPFGNDDIQDDDEEQPIYGFRGLLAGSEHARGNPAVGELMRAVRNALVDRDQETARGHAQELASLLLGGERQEGVLGQIYQQELPRVVGEILHEIGGALDPDELRAPHPNDEDRQSDAFRPPFLEEQDRAQREQQFRDSGQAPLGNNNAQDDDEEQPVYGFRGLLAGAEHARGNPAVDELMQAVRAALIDRDQATARGHAQELADLLLGGDRQEGALGQIYQQELPRVVGEILQEIGDALDPDELRAPLPNDEDRQSDAFRPRFVDEQDRNDPELQDAADTAEGRRKVAEDAEKDADKDDEDKETESDTDSKKDDHSRDGQDRNGGGGPDAGGSSAPNSGDTSNGTAGRQPPPPPPPRSDRSSAGQGAGTKDQGQKQTQDDKSAKQQELLKKHIKKEIEHISDLLTMKNVPDAKSKAIRLSKIIEKAGGKSLSPADILRSSKSIADAKSKGKKGAKPAAAQPAASGGESAPADVITLGPAIVKYVNWKTFCDIYEIDKEEIEEIKKIAKKALKDIGQAKAPCRKLLDRRAQKGKTKVTIKNEKYLASAMVHAAQLRLEKKKLTKPMKMSERPDEEQ